MRPSRLAACAAFCSALLIAGCARAPVATAPVAPPRATVPASTRTAAGASAAPAPEPPAVAPAASAHQVEPVLVFHGDPASNAVALTFDLCETPTNPAGFDRALVDVLEKTRTPATFMMGGHWAETHAGAARELGAVSWFEIGDHSYSHAHPLQLTPAALDLEITKAQQVISSTTGRTPRVYRFPYGEQDEATVRRVASLGLVPVQWSIETGDPDRNVTADDIVREVKRRAKGGAIVIMHGNGRGWHSAEALPRVIAALKAKGLRLVTVSDLLGLGR